MPRKQANCSIIGGPAEFAPPKNLAKLYVHKHIFTRLWPAYLHGGEGLHKPLVSSITKQRHSQGGEESKSDSDASQQSILDLDNAPPVVKES